MGSGDVGWVGLAVSMAELLRDQGYLEASQVPGDHAEIAASLRRRGLLHEPVIVSGVSEGAGLAILAASSSANHEWMAGVITMGSPGTAELAWRWTDFTS